VIALIDGDILTYRIGFAYNDEGFALARHMLGETIQTICEELKTEDFELFITGKTNFRNDYAVTEPYKGNRKGDKPVHYQELRDYMLEIGAVLVEEQEADDAIAIRATELGDKCYMVSIDKDFDQIKGWHYNFVKKQQYYISKHKALSTFICSFLLVTALTTSLVSRESVLLKPRSYWKARQSERCMKSVLRNWVVKREQ
jgi:hypothetical protein